MTDLTSQTLCSSNMQGIKGKCSPQGKRLFLCSQQHFGGVVVFIGLLCASPSNKILIIQDSGVVDGTCHMPPLFFTLTNPGASNLTT